MGRGTIGGMLAPGTRGRALRCAVVMLVALRAGTSRAGEPSKTELATARDLFSRAERDEDLGRWADAVDKMRRAGSVKMTPGIRFHIALCEERLGQLLAALADYNAAEAAARTEGNREVLDLVAQPLAALRARVPTLAVTLPADAKDATVSLDGTPLAVGLLGTQVPIEVGSHTVQATAAGNARFSATVTAAESEAVALEVRFSSAGPARATAPSTAEGSSQSAPERSSPGQPRTLAIATTAGAAALVGFGIASYFIAGGRQSSAETACVQMTSCDDLKGGVRTWDAVALGSWIAAAGVAGLSVWFWTRAPARSESSARAHVDVGPGRVELRAEF